MRSAEEWGKDCCKLNKKHPITKLMKRAGIPDTATLCPLSIAIIRAIQADALRWAAERAAARCEGNDNHQMAQYARCIAAQADAIEQRNSRVSK